MLRSNVSDHGMRKYCLGIYKHMPGGLEAHSSYFFVRPVAKLRKTIEQAQQQEQGRDNVKTQVEEVQHQADRHAEVLPTSGVVV